MCGRDLRKAVWSELRIEGTALKCRLMGVRSAWGQGLPPYEREEVSLEIRGGQTIPVSRKDNECCQNLVQSCASPLTHGWSCQL
jgi:hypothetical protein